MVMDAREQRISLLVTEMAMATQMVMATEMETVTEMEVLNPSTVHLATAMETEMATAMVNLALFMVLQKMIMVMGMETDVQMVYMALP